MRILMLNNEFPPLGGGTATVNFELLKCLKEFPDLEIDLITSAGRLTYGTEQFSPNIKIYKLPISRRCIHHASNLELALYSFEALLLSLILSIKNKYALAFAWCTLPAGAVTRILKLARGIPYVVRVSGPDIPGFEERYSSVLKYLRPGLIQCWKHAKTLVTKCTTEASLIRASFPSARIVEIRNGVVMPPIKEIAIGKFMQGESPLKIICVGRLITRKRQADLIEALRRMRELGYSVRLQIVGLGDDETRLRQLTSSSGLDDLISFLGYVPRSELSNLLARADVFVLPSQQEGMSVATLEAMAAGLPLVISKVGGAEALVTEGVNGYTFAPGDVDRLTKILVEMYDTGDLNKMGVASRAHAQTFGWQAVAQEYYKLFSATVAACAA